MGNLIPPNKQKLTMEASLFALRAMACDTQIKDVANLVKQKYNIEISAARLSNMKTQAKWKKHFDNFQMEYLGKCGQSTGIYIADTNNRLKIAQELLEECLHSSTFQSDRERIETALKCLKHAKEESTAAEKAQEVRPNIMNFIKTVNIDKKEPIVIGEAINGQIISENKDQGPVDVGSDNSTN